MIATGHNGLGTLVGLSVIALSEGYDWSVTQTFLIAFILGMIFHYLGDMLPHGHIFARSIKKNIKTIIIFDLFGTFGIIFLVALWKFGFTPQLVSICLAVLGTQLPDVLGALEYMGKIPVRGVLKIERYLHQDISHWHGKGEDGLPWRKRDVWQLLLYLSSIYFIIKF